MPGCRHQPASFWPPAHARLLPPICSRSAWPHSDGALPRRYLRRPGARCQHQAIAPDPLLPFILCAARCCVLARLPRSRPRPTAAAALPARTTCACPALELPPGCCFVSKRKGEGRGAAVLASSAGQSACTAGARGAQGRPLGGAQQAPTARLGQLAFGPPWLKLSKVPDFPTNFF